MRLPSVSPVARALDSNATTAGEDSLPKLSEILLDFAGPYLGEGEPTLAEMESAVGFVMLVWNAAVLDRLGEGAWPVLLDAFWAGEAGAPEEAVEVAEAMRLRKLALHGTDLRGIVDFDVFEEADEFRVRVTSMNLGPGGWDVYEFFEQQDRAQRRKRSPRRPS